MQQLADWYFALVFFVTLLGFLVSGILFFVNKTDTFSSKLLAGFLVSICIMVMNNELMATRFFLNFPHFWRTSVFASFCFQAFGYLYVRSVLEQSYKFKKWDFLFFLPAIIYPLTLIPFYILPTAEKLAIIKTIIADNRLIAAEPEGLLPKGLGTLTRLAYGIILSVAQFAMLIKWKRNFKLSEGHYVRNKDTFRWLNYFTSMTASLYVVLFISVGFQLQIYFSIWQLLILFATCCNLFIIGYLLLKPSILLKPSMDRILLPGDATSFSDVRDNVHWHEAETDGVLLVVYCKDLGGFPARQVMVDPVNAQDAGGGLLRAPLLPSLGEALERFG